MSTPTGEWKFMTKKEHAAELKRLLVKLERSNLQLLESLDSYELAERTYRYAQLQRRACAIDYLRMKYPEQP